MISLFLHLLALAYGTVNLCGTLSFMPLAFIALWVYATFLLLVHWLPDRIDTCIAAGQIPSFTRTQEKFQWGVVAWILLLHAVADPVRLMLPAYADALPQTLPMLVSLLLYVALARPVMFEMFRLFKPILDLQQTSADFFRARMTIPILFFPPIQLWMLVEDLTSSGMEALVEIKVMAFAPIFFIGLYLLSPKLFNWAWRAEDNQDAALEETIRKLSERAAAPVSGVKIWDTFNEPVPNAAVAGLSRRFRFVYLTRYLLSIFTPQQVESVVAHELGHLRLGHVATYMIYSINLILLSVMLKLGVIAYFPEYYTTSTIASLAEMLFFLVFFAVTFTALARFSEHQADAFAAAATDPQVFASGLETLNSMILPPPSIIPPWLLTHPQIQDRISRVRSGAGHKIADLLSQARLIRYSLVVLGMVLLLAASAPAVAVFRISDLFDAVQAGNCRSAMILHRSLPEWLKKHPLVLQETGKLAVNCGSFGLAAPIAAEVSWGVSVVPVSEVFHHPGAPEVTFDLKVVQLVLKSLDLW